MTITPTPEQIRIAKLNGWDPQEHAENNARVARMHELMRKHTKPQLLAMAFAGGLADCNQPARWSKQEIAGAVAEQQLRASQR